MAGPAPAAKPNLEGLWMLHREMRSYGQGAGTDVPGGWFAFNGFRGPVPKPPLLPAILEGVIKHKTVEQSAQGVEGGVDPQTAVCQPAGFPDYLAHGDPLHILESTEEMVMITERERFYPRHVYIGHKHPDLEEYAFSLNGHAVANWEGQTLVIDTIGFNSEPWMIMYDRIPRSEKLHVVERLRLENDGKLLVNEVTITDPEVLSRPWQFTLRYDRAPPGQEIIESICVRADAGPQH